MNCPALGKCFVIVLCYCVLASCSHPCTFPFVKSQNGIYCRKCGMGKDHRDWCRYTYASHVQSVALGEFDYTRTDSTSVGIMVASRILAHCECLVGGYGTRSPTISRQAIEKVSRLFQATRSVEISPSTGFGLSQGWDQNGMDGRDWGRPPIQQQV